MAQGGRFLRRVGTAAVAVCTIGVLFGTGSGPVSAATSVASVRGSAFGYQDNVSLLGGPANAAGPTPTEALASDASNSPQSVTATSGNVTFGPSTLFTSNAITVQSSGSLGVSGSATSSSTLNSINETGTSGNDGEILSATQMTGSCSASGAGTSGSTSITGGTLQTNDSPVTDQTLATNPAPNTAITGLLHPFAGQTDHFVVVFNEQVANSDGSLTVNAAHEYLGYQIVSGVITPDPAYPAAGSSAAQGNLLIGQAVCGVTGGGTDFSVQNPPITHTPNPVPAGQNVTFTVTVSNLGPSDASAVDTATVAGGKFVSATASNGGTCAAPKGRKPATCSWSTIASGTGATVQVVVAAPRKAGGSISISSTVSSPADTNLSNNTGTDSVNVQ